MMSKQLALSSALSVIAMSAFALFSSASVDSLAAGSSAPITIKASAALPAATSFLPGLR